MAFCVAVVAEHHPLGPFAFASYVVITAAVEARLGRWVLRHWLWAIVDQVTGFIAMSADQWSLLWLWAVSCSVALFFAVEATSWLCWLGTSSSTVAFSTTVVTDHSRFGLWAVPVPVTLFLAVRAGHSSLCTIFGSVALLLAVQAHCWSVAFRRHVTLSIAVETFLGPLGLLAVSSGMAFLLTIEAFLWSFWFFAICGCVPFFAAVETGLRFWRLRTIGRSVTFLLAVVALHGPSFLLGLGTVLGHVAFTLAIKAFHRASISTLIISSVIRLVSGAPVLLISIRIITPWIFLYKKTNEINYKFGLCFAMNLLFLETLDVVAMEFNKLSC